MKKNCSCNCNFIFLFRFIYILMELNWMRCNKRKRFEQFYFCVKIKPVTDTDDMSKMHASKNVVVSLTVPLNQRWMERLLKTLSEEGKKKHIDIQHKPKQTLNTTHKQKERLSNRRMSFDCCKNRNCVGYMSYQSNHIK